MKTLKKIKLHNLSQTEMADKEQNILRGGAVYCISVCLDAACACKEVGDGSGNFPSSDNNTNSSPTEIEAGVSEAVRKS